jgi:hypothetical protein
MSSGSALGLGWKFRICAILVILLTSTCSESAPPPQPSPSVVEPTRFVNWPPALNNFRFHWNASPGIDIHTGPLVSVRAYMESYRSVNLTGGESSAVYPGFWRATPENGRRAEGGYPFELERIRPELRNDQPQGSNDAAMRIYGYAPFYVLSFSKVGDIYRAILCEGEYSVFRPADEHPGMYRSITSWPPQDTADKGITVWRVELTDKEPRVGPNPPAAPTNPQSGPLPAPTGDVFGPWFITGASSSLWGTPGPEAQYVDTPEVKQQCAEHMPDDAAARKAMYTGLHDQPPPHGDPLPGWPAN